MAVRLLRESSDTPNIANKDDVRMARYAYGGTDGIVKNYGSELSYDSTNKSFSIGSGMLVVQGWEIMVDGLGWSIDFSAMPTGLFYYSIYVEVNAEVESATIKSLYDTSSYPSVDPGDDLTQSPSGTARFLIYSVQVSNQNVTSVRRDAPVLEHLVPYINDQVIPGIKNDITEAFTSGKSVPKYSDLLSLNRLTIVTSFELKNGRASSIPALNAQGLFLVQLENTGRTSFGTGILFKQKESGLYSVPLGYYHLSFVLSSNYSSATLLNSAGAVVDENYSGTVTIYRIGE